MKKPESDDKYANAKKKRKKYVHDILTSPKRKKIVVAGPGTGKTCLFKKILEGKKDSLTLTFVNALVEDLSLELCGLSDVRTLHSFAHKTLRLSSENIKVFPGLPDIIREDAKILIDKEINFDKIFYNRDDCNENIIFYKKRKDYYGEYYGYSDIIFAVVKYFEQNKNKIPAYNQLLVDEFQDFNKLEVSLIDLLSEKSPVLLVGDDDQALYETLKSASPDHIRERHSEKYPDYASFSLPYCSRCTRVIVEAVNDIITNARRNGFLKNRINKLYHYFEDEIKDTESEKYPKIVYYQQFAARIPWFITKQVTKIAEQIKDKFSVLIISPTRRQARDIFISSKEKGLVNIEFVEKKDNKKSFLIDGLKILLNDRKSNLGWRIVCRSLMDGNDFESLLNKTNIDGPKSISEIVDKNLKKEVSAMIKLLRSIKNDKVVDGNDFADFLTKLEYNPYEQAKELLKDEITSFSHQHVNRAIATLPIKCTTIQGSKGLSADIVFITHFDDQYLIKDKDDILDQEICNFLVALTRAKRKVFLISSNTKERPTFLSWIDEDRLDMENK